MIVHIDDLVRLLQTTGLPQQGISPDEILAIVFGPETRRSKESVEYERIDRGAAVIDYDKDQNIVCIELINVPFDHKWRKTSDQNKGAGGTADRE